MDVDLFLEWGVAKYGHVTSLMVKVLNVCIHIRISYYVLIERTKFCASLASLTAFINFKKRV